MSTPVLLPSELGREAKKLGWNSTVQARMSLRYLAAITEVQFGDHLWTFALEAGTSSMDMGGGAVVGAPAEVAAQAAGSST